MAPCFASIPARDEQHQQGRCRFAGAEGPGKIGHGRRPPFPLLPVSDFLPRKSIRRFEPVARAIGKCRLTNRPAPPPDSSPLTSMPAPLSDPATLRGGQLIPVSSKASAIGRSRNPPPFLSAHPSCWRVSHASADSPITSPGNAGQIAPTQQSCSTDSQPEKQTRPNALQPRRTRSPASPLFDQ